MNKTVLELQKDKVAVTAGVYKGNMVVHCELDGDLTIKWDDDSTTVYSMIAGSDVEIRDTQMKDVTISSGSFTIMNY